MPTEDEIEEQAAVYYEFCHRKPWAEADEKMRDIYRSEARCDLEYEENNPQ